MPARYTKAERFREGKGIIAGIADSNLPEPLHEAAGAVADAIYLAEAWSRCQADTATGLPESGSFNAHVCPASYCRIRDACP